MVSIMTDTDENKIKIVTFLLLLITSLFTMVDITTDMKAGEEFRHLFFEFGLWLTTMIGAYFQFRIIKWQSKEMSSFKEKINELGELNTQLSETIKKEQIGFEKKITHLSIEFLNYIDEQFNQWAFSRGEKEIALLLIKGLSMKEIADIRGSNENTVRQQASQIYKKSRLGGRMELSAFFLDDLLAQSKLPQ